MEVLSALSIACRRVAPKIACKTRCGLHFVNCSNSITSNAMQSLIYGEEALRGGMTSDALRRFLYADLFSTAFRSRYFNFFRDKKNYTK